MVKNSLCCFVCKSEVVLCMNQGSLATEGGESWESVRVLRCYRTRLCSVCLLISLFALHQHILCILPVRFAMNDTEVPPLIFGSTLWMSSLISHGSSAFRSCGHFQFTEAILPPKEGLLGCAVAAGRGKLGLLRTLYPLTFIHSHHSLFKVCWWFSNLVRGRNGKCCISLSIVGPI